MKGIVTWLDLGLAALIVLGILVGIYLLRLLKNANDSAKIVKSILKANKESIDKTLEDMPAIARNFAEISDTAKNQAKVIEKTLNSLSETAEMTAATASTIKNDIIGRIKGVFELIDILKRVFFGDKDSKVASLDKQKK